MSAALEAVQVPSVNGTEAGSAVRAVFVVSRALESSCPQSLVHFFDRLLGFLNAGRWSRQFQCVPETQGHAEMKSTSNVCGVNPYVSFSVQTYTDTFQSSVSPPSPSPLPPAASVRTQSFVDNSVDTCMGNSQCDNDREKKKEERNSSIMMIVCLKSNTSLNRIDLLLAFFVFVFLIGIYEELLKQRTFDLR